MARPDQATTFGSEQLGAIFGPRPAGFDQLPLSPWGSNVPVLGLGRDQDRDSWDAVAPFRLWAIAAVAMAAVAWLGVLGLAVSPGDPASAPRLFS